MHRQSLDIELEVVILYSTLSPAGLVCVYICTAEVGSNRL